MEIWLGLWERYWSWPMLQVNGLILANLLGALALGLVVGYERTYRGRAAGMRTYGIVCMASAALTVFAGYPQAWWGQAQACPLFGADPTRVIQGIVTGIGFLGAGVIMRDGLTISGLTTAASIWATSAIGVLVGVGLYGAAIVATGMTAVLMLWGARWEGYLPARATLAVTVTSGDEVPLAEEAMFAVLKELGFSVVEGSLRIQSLPAATRWYFVAEADRARAGAVLPEVARRLRACVGVQGKTVAQPR